MPPSSDMKSGIRYVNTGDWVESCTAVAEHQDGTLEIIRWNRSVRMIQEDALEAARRGSGATNGVDARRGVSRTRFRTAHAHSHRHRRVASPGERRRAHAGTRGGRGARRWDIDVLFLTPSLFHTVPLPSYPEIRLAMTPPGAVARLRQEIPPRPSPHRHRGAARTGGAACLPQSRLELHDQLSHAFPGISAGAAADSGELDLCVPAPLPQCRTRHARRDEISGAGTRGQGFHQGPPVDARRRCGDCTARARGACSICRARSSCPSVGSRSRRISRPFCRSTCRAPRSWSARDRRSPCSKARYPDAVFLGKRTGEELARIYALGRCVRVSEPDRHIRHRHSRGARERRAGRGLSP